MRDEALVMKLLQAFHLQGVNYELKYVSSWHQVDGYNKEWVLQADEHDLVDALMEYFSQKL